MYKVMLINESPSKTEDAQVQPTYRNRCTNQRERERERERELLKRSNYILNYQMKKGIMNSNMLCSSD